LLYDWGMIRKLKPGYCALFYGPPGTGKSLTASLLGKRTGRDVYRIDLSKTISKYIGETEKNLAGIFDRAEHKDWILFFDEADALFGKRTNISDAHDRYANQEVSYLLQRREEYNGLVILASNLKSNLDEAFTRRFQAMIQFPMPQTAERLQLWEKGFSNKTVLESHEELQEIARSYELSGGSIINVIQHSSLMALRRGEHVIQTRDIMDGIKREYRKIGRTI
ncbi:MAG: ATP-binding protein, partial [Cyclobacteriaceae bacterium]